MKKRSGLVGRVVTIVCIGAIVAGIYLLLSGAVTLLTPDQQAWRTYQQGDLDTAAAQFRDPMWKGVALFKAGDFEQAAGVFAGFNTADAAFNRGNALLMRGSYDAAAESYSRALELRAEWDDARINRDIALGRAARLKQEGGEGTGGKLGADDIVFSDSPSPPSAGEEQTEGGQPLSEMEINALWLRQVQTKPADFLAAKFAYQYATRPEHQSQQGSIE
jgi:Ca-activated chloride channel family protein